MAAWKPVFKREDNAQQAATFHAK